MDLAHSGKRVLFMMTPRTTLDMMVGAMMAALLKRPIGQELPHPRSMNTPLEEQTVVNMHFLHSKWRDEVEAAGGELKSLQILEPAADFGIPDLGEFVPDMIFFDEYWPHEDTGA